MAYGSISRWMVWPYSVSWAPSNLYKGSTPPLDFLCLIKIHQALAHLPVFAMISSKVQDRHGEERFNDNRTRMEKPFLRGAAARMGLTKSSSNVIVPQVLRKDNYQEWRIFMKSYLLGQGLWDLVVGNETAESTKPKAKKWAQRNAKALHAILISCGEEVFSRIRDTDSAKEAWDLLASQFPQDNTDEAADNKYPSEAETNFRRDQSRRMDEFPSSSFRRRRGEFSSRPGSPFSISEEEEEPAAETDFTRRTIYQALLLDDLDKMGDELWKKHAMSTDVVTPNVGTILHVAVSTGNLELVQHLLESMSSDVINRNTNTFPNTALNLAAINGLTEIAEELVKKSGDSLYISDEFGYIPVTSASCYGHKDTTRYLYRVTRKEVLVQDDKRSGATLLNTAIMYDMYDIAIDLLSRCGELAITYDGTGSTTIQVLATKPDAFPSGLDCKWQRWIYSCISIYNERGINSGDVAGDTYMDQKHHIVDYGIRSLYNKKRIHCQALEVLKRVCSQLSSLNESDLQAFGVEKSIFCATKLGIVEIVAELIKIEPNLLFALDEENRNIFFVAVKCRQEKIFNLICGIRGSLALVSTCQDKYKNTLLHLAGICPPFFRRGKMPGDALQMQRELQWYQEVEKITPSPAREHENLDGWRARRLFTETHKELVKDGETWMINTAQSCMVLATLIATITFAAAFTVPGGSNQDSGFPIFLRRKLFLFFVVSDALSLFSSATSLLAFLSIYTSHYPEEDFLESLPKRLVIGLTSLFFSIATMVVAFCATLFLVLSRRHIWVAIPITFLAACPVMLFIKLQFPLFLDMVISTYGPGLFKKPKRALAY